MMSSEEMTKRVLGRVEEHEKKIRRRNSMIRRYAAVSASLCAAVLLCIGIYRSQVPIVPRNNADENIFISETTDERETFPADTSSDEKNLPVTAANISVSTKSTSSTEAAPVITEPPIAETSASDDAEIEIVQQDTKPCVTSTDEQDHTDQPMPEQPLSPPEISDPGSVETSRFTPADMTADQISSCFPAAVYNGMNYVCTGTVRSLEPLTADGYISISAAVNCDVMTDSVYATVYVLSEDSIAVLFEGRSDLIIYTLY